VNNQSWGGDCFEVELAGTFLWGFIDLQLAWTNDPVVVEEGHFALILDAFCGEGSLASNQRCISCCNSQVVLNICGADKKRPCKRYPNQT
jgi:hypothetical protein